MRITFWKERKHESETKTNTVEPQCLVGCYSNSGGDTLGESMVVLPVDGTCGYLGVAQSETVVLPSLWKEFGTDE